jgi:hypothetical protein
MYFVNNLVRRSPAPNFTAEEREYMPDTCWFSSGDGDGYYFTVLPRRDLFLLQIQDLGRIYWKVVDESIQLGSTLRGFSGIQHFALEYNSEWWTQLGQPVVLEKAIRTDIVKIFARRALDPEQDRRIWFLDYNLRRRPDAPPVDEDCTTFHATDRRWVERKLIDSEGTDQDNWEYMQGEEDDERGSSSIHFTRLIDYAMSDWWWGYQPEIKAENIGLLGWDCF